MDTSTLGVSCVREDSFPLLLAFERTFMLLLLCVSLLPSQCSSLFRISSHWKFKHPEMCTDPLVGLLNLKEPPKGDFRQS